MRQYFFKNSSLKNRRESRTIMQFRKYQIYLGVLILLSFGTACTNKNYSTSGIPGYKTGIEFAHRGVVVSYPENSMESINDALSKGFTALEIDLRKNSHGEWMLFHDKSGQRLLGIDSNFNEIPVETLKTTALLFNGNRSSSNVISLSDLLKYHSRDFTFYFDVKVTGFKEAEEIADTIAKYGISNSVIVASADAAFILYLEWKHPELFTALEGMNSGKEWTWKSIPTRFKPDFLSGFFDKIDKSHIKWLKKNSLLERRIVYGIDSANYLKARQYGIKHLIVDYYPGML